MNTTLGRKTRLIALAVLASLGGLASVGLEAQPAAAATSVSFCFSYANPPTNSAYANKPVYLYELLPHGQWKWVRTGMSNAAGCGTFYNTNPTVKLLVKPYTSTQFMTWTAEYVVPAGGSAARLGSPGATLPVFRS